MVARPTFGGPNYLWRYQAEPNPCEHRGGGMQAGPSGNFTTFRGAGLFIEMSAVARDVISQA